MNMVASLNECKDIGRTFRWEIYPSYIYTERAPRFFTRINYKQLNLVRVEIEKKYIGVYDTHTHSIFF